jgi:hypothetical protein
VVASGGYFLIRLGPTRAFARAVGFVSAGVLLAYVVNPLHAARTGGKAQLQPGGFVPRFRRAWNGAEGFFDSHMSVIATAAVIAVIVLVARRYTRKPLPGWTRVPALGEATILVLPGLTVAAMGAVHGLKIVPSHAMGAKYLAHVWLLMAVASVAIVRMMPLVLAAPGMVIVVVLIASDALGRVPQDASVRELLEPHHVSQKLVTIETHNRLHLPRSLFQIAPDARIYKAWTPALLDEFEDWTRPMTDRALWIASEAGMNGRKRKALVAKLREEGFRVRIRYWNRHMKAYHLEPRRW